MIKKFLQLIIIIFLFPNILKAKTDYFNDAVNLFKVKKFDKAKFKFEQDIVLNPKSELSYLYLSKIFKNLNKKNLEEQNLITVLLLNPKNEEAIYNLAKLKLEASDYKKSKELNKRLISLCVNLCQKSIKLNIEIDNLSKK
jgi:tetratricopeptide (TPR) repeat protein